MSVGAVTVFIDVCSFYMVNHYTFPLVLDNCSRGWVNNIIITSSAHRKVGLHTVLMMHTCTVLIAFEVTFEIYLYLILVTFGVSVKVD